jgi:hypothetical protein
MAIDTASKRASILGFGSGDLLPVPSGALEAGDRLTLLWLYSGIDAGNIVIVSGPFCVCATQVFVPGSVATQVFVPGAVAAQGECC